MLAALYILSAVCVMLLISLCISLYFNIKHGVIILKIGDAIEECLDVFEESYAEFNNILQRELFMDSYEIRQVVDKIKIMRDKVLYLSGVLQGSLIEGEDSENEAEEESF